ncbi:MAG: pirin family protein [Chitinophagaceae bacterium]|nr:MAG: pirin family protein [Chitinophagaceae bacterium]
MKTVLHKAESRGSFDYGWLKTNYSFSFSSWQNPEKVHFGVLRVLNDDTIAAGMGFGTHSHDNMEIITIPTSGQLEHKDSMGNHGIISKGEVQVMSAGSGIQHSEYNNSKEFPVSLFQIWLFSNKKNVAPRYDQRSFDFDSLKNEFCTIVSPMGENTGLNIHQDAWFSLGKLDKDFSYNYNLKNKNNGVYLFLIEGNITLNKLLLKRRDAVEITEFESLEIISNSNSELLLLEIPM